MGNLLVDDENHSCVIKAILKGTKMKALECQQNFQAILTKSHVNFQEYNSALNIVAFIKFDISLCGNTEKSHAAEITIF